MTKGQQKQFSTSDLNNWQAFDLMEMLPLLEELEVPWCIAGGYAIELFIGETFRDHDDIDILIFRKDQLLVQKHFSDWEMYYGTRPGLAFWKADHFLNQPYYDIWARKGSGQAWKFQLMLMDTQGEEWIFKRNPVICGLQSDLIQRSDKDIPIINPAVQLLYKAKNIRPKDELDFHKTIPHLTKEDRKWLAKHLAILYPDVHPWKQYLTTI